jgi:hypothetical protein
MNAGPIDIDARCWLKPGCLIRNLSLRALPCSGLMH